ncbi:unnamed protein product [Arctogadus glacialis]
MDEVLQPTGTQEDQTQLAEMQTPCSLQLVGLHRLLHQDPRAQLVPKRIVLLKVTQVQPDLGRFLICGSPSPKMDEVLQPTGTQEEKDQLAKKDTPCSLQLVGLHRLLHQDPRAQLVPKRIVLLKVTQVQPDLGRFLICGSPSPKKAEVLQPTGTQEEKDQLAKMATPGSLLLAPLYRLLYPGNRACEGPAWSPHVSGIRPTGNFECGQK